LHTGQKAQINNSPKSISNFAFAWLDVLENHDSKSIKITLIPAILWQIQIKIEQYRGISYAKD
jgi:hypothetical protein